ncbi:ubiquitin-conjugating enzyme E2-17 kDa-like isoform X1 [Mytilus californianus]|uniref:ubiquitin-conjugating enzyme E2-17 kDa-like isoform X1 n=1 Tax=Mytilus californianus TaxID=6549 RepID=UPI0022482327|nr:ubiquitin-conjugating enzyme E2-17 kDa-like isoform X1 [Mytilus californianus]
MALRIINKQFQQLWQEIPEEFGFTAGPLEDDLLHWQASLLGPTDSPYSSGRFFLRLDFTTDFPFKPPKILFQTKIYHPNVTEDGKICADFLTEWKPSFSIGYILQAIQSLLLFPNADNPAAPEVAKEFLDNKEQFEKTAVEWTKSYAVE